MYRSYERTLLQRVKMMNVSIHFLWKNTVFFYQYKKMPKKQMPVEEVKVCEEKNKPYDCSEKIYPCQGKCL